MKTIYYLPGRDNRITDQTGMTIQKLGYEVIGRNLLPDFINYRIVQQIEIIKQDINEFLAGGGSILVA